MHEFCRDASAYMLCFRGIDSRMRDWIIAKPHIKSRRPYRAKAAERDKHPAPANNLDQHGRQEGSEGAANL